MNLYNFLQNKLGQKPVTASVEQVKAAMGSKEQHDLLRKFGVVTDDLRQALSANDLINFERSSLYTSIDRSLVHPLMAAAPSLFADVATSYNRVQNATVWVTAKSKEYQYQIEKMLEIINIEECIYDWAWTVATFGDLFVQNHGEPGLGLVSINDDAHPINLSRVDYNGRLIGFYDTPGGYNASDERKLLTPWSYTHFRLLGAKRRRPAYGGADSNYSEFRTVSIMAPDVRRLTSKYGTSVLSDALPIFKRLRLAEDSILMARITRGVLRNVWKIGIDKTNSNHEAIANLIDQYVSTLKEARSLNIDTNNPGYNSKFNAMANIEDIIIPVWGDVNQVVADKIGGEVDIKWIEDVDLLTKQLSTALKVPLPLLAGYAEAANGGIGQNSLEKLDIRFARQARRIQRALIVGLTRLAQVHLSYQGINPDMEMFQIHMSETSTAEELELQEALDRGLDVTGKMLELLDNVLGPDLDKREALEYLNEKFLKLNDLEIDKIIRKGNPNAFDVPASEDTLGGGMGGGSSAGGGSNPFSAHAPQGETVPGEETPAPSTEPEETEEESANPFKENMTIADLRSQTPLNEAQWNATWGSMKVKITPVTGTK